MSFGLSQKTITQLKSVFKKYPEVSKVKIYGSRVTNHYRIGSDIDLAFFSESEKDLSSNLSWDLDDLPCPYLFDVVNYSTLNDSPLREEIDKYGRVLYKKTHSSLAQQKSISKQKLSPQQLSLPQQSSFPRSSSFPRKRESKKIHETKHSFAFKQTEIGEIPENWSVCIIDELFDLKQGKSLSSKNQTGMYLKPFLRTSNVFWGHLGLKKVDEMDIPDKDRESLVLKKGDLLVCEGGDIGRTAIWNEELKECYYQNHVHRLRVKGDRKKDIFPLFYMYWMDAAVRKLNVYGTFGNRTTIPNLSGKRLLKFKIPRPPFSEQRKIAGVLSQIQRAIEIQDGLIETTKELKKSTMKQLFTYGVEREKTKQTEVGKIPANWSVCIIDELFDLKQGKSLSSKNQTGMYLKPFLRTSNVFWGHLELKKVDEMDIPDKDRKFLLLKKGDLLVCEGGDIGRTAIWNEELKECYYQNHIHRLRAKGDRRKGIFPLFYMYWMDAAIRELNVYGTFGNRTTIPNLSGKRLLKFKVPLLPMKEQKKIASVLNQIDQKIQVHQKKKSSLEELFKTTLSKLMTGKTRVHRMNIDINLLEQ